MSPRAETPNNGLNDKAKNASYPNEKGVLAYFFGTEIDTCYTVTKTRLKGSGNYLFPSLFDTPVTKKIKIPG